MKYTQETLSERMKNLTPYLEGAIQRAATREYTKYPQLYFDSITAAAAVLATIRCRFTLTNNLLAGDVNDLAEKIGRIMEIEEQLSKRQP